MRWFSLFKKSVEFVWRFIERTDEDDLFGLAAQIAFYFLLAVFPMLFFIVTLLPLLHFTNEQFLALVERFIPGVASETVQVILQEVAQRPHVGLLSLGILVALWSASSGVNSVVLALNRAYHVKKGRSFLMQRLQSMGLTIGMLVALAVSLVLPVFGKQIGLLILGDDMLHQSWLLWLLRWGITLLVLVAVFTTLYYFGPNLKIRFRRTLPGAVFASIGWLISSSLFAVYVDQFADLPRTYGSLGGPIILLLWFYITGLFIVLGGELNAFLDDRKIYW